MKKLKHGGTPKKPRTHTTALDVSNYKGSKAETIAHIDFAAGTFRLIDSGTEIVPAQSLVMQTHERPKGPKTTVQVQHGPGIATLGADNSLKQFDLLIAIDTNFKGFFAATCAILFVIVIQPNGAVGLAPYHRFLVEYRGHSEHP